MRVHMEYEKLQKLLAEILEVEPEQIRREKSFVRDYGADSLMLYQILMGVEAVFGVIVEEEEAVRWNTVGQLWEYLQTGRGITGKGLAQ
jgi:acyl carrier protein